MGRRGPVPKPSAIKRAEGTYRPDRAASNEYQPPSGEPEMPDDLDPVARAHWQRLVPLLLANKVLTVVDGGVLELLCQTYSLAKLHSRLAMEAPTVETDKGTRPSPMAREASKWVALYRQYAAEFGISPATRVRGSAIPGRRRGPERPAGRVPTRWPAADRQGVAMAARKPKTARQREPQRSPADRFEIAEVAFDPWQATQLAQELEAEGLATVEVRPTAQRVHPQREAQGGGKR